MKKLEEKKERTGYNRTIVDLHSVFNDIQIYRGMVSHSKYNVYYLKSYIVE